MAQNLVKSVLYSQTADQTLAPVVRRITGKHDCFATDFMQSRGVVSSAIRLEAFKNPLNGLWQIDRFTRTPIGSEITIRQEPEFRSGLCFFDALHYCAAFQGDQEFLGALPTVESEPRWASIPSWREAALAAGQAIDRDDMVHPCAFGRILTGGDFAPDALEIAMKTKGMSIDPSAPIPQDNVLDQITAGLLKDTDTLGKPDTILTKAIQKRDLVNQFRAAVESGDNLMRLFRYAVDHKFVGLRWSLAKDLLTLGLKRIRYYQKGDLDFFPARAIELAQRKFDDSISKLPDGQNKKILVDFSTSVKCAVHMEQAASIYDRCVAKEIPSKDLQKGIPHIQNAGTISGLPDADIELLKSKYLDGGIRRSSYYDSIRNSWHYEVESPRGLFIAYIGKGIEVDIKAYISHLESSRGP